MTAITLCGNVAFMRFPSLRFLAGPALLALALTPVLAAQQTAAEKTAEQVFKNIQVFKGRPASELRPTMSFIASSLGVRCNFCHVQPFSADTKPQKRTARRMIEMVFAINKANFNGRPEINCFTCHQGHTEPNGALSIAADAPPAAMPAGGRGAGRGAGRGGFDRTNLPTAAQVLAKYEAALGGAGALAAIRSETMTVQQAMMGRTMTLHMVKQGGKFALTEGAGRAGYDGSRYWSWRGRGAVAPAAGEMATELAIYNGLYPAAGLDAAKARVFARVPFEGGKAYLMAARTANGFVRYYFDASTGLLRRIITGTPTYLGMLPLQVDYSNYQSVGGGVKLPFTMQFSNHERTWTQTVSNVKLNQPVEASALAAPAGGN